VLESTATKRDAKAYLSRFGPQKPASLMSAQSSPKLRGIGVDLGDLYVPVRAVDENPVFSTEAAQLSPTDEAIESLHIAIVKIRAPQTIDHATLHGVAHTLSQLTRLGMSCAIVVDPEDGQHRSNSEEVRTAVEQADRMVAVFEASSIQSARRLDSVVGVASNSKQIHSSIKLSGKLRITDRDQILIPLRRGVTPIIAPIGFTSDTSKRVAVDADEVVLALAQDFAGLQEKAVHEGDSGQVAEEIKSLQKQLSLDRIIVVDPLGGIPFTDKTHGSHVFINLEQEFEAIRRDLIKQSGLMGVYGSFTPSSDLRALDSSNPPSNLVANEPATVSQKRPEYEDTVKPDLHGANSEFHVKNLELMRNTLALLPPSSSAFLTTPDAVANSQSRPPLASQGPRVRTRRQKNSLIHNLLTDKPVYSPSLPPDRSPNQAWDALLSEHNPLQATFFKRGMPVSLIPDPLADPWTAPSPSKPSISISDPRIDLPRLIYLIENSFSRKLDIPHYLNRIKNRIAGIIIAGEYEGGAILTWETPPGYPVDDPNHMVPYLDKFAILKRSQGSGGVSDIVFKAMVRDCFPEGVCWRSRKDNPVNKWYFERANGTCQILNSNWTMFWTTENVGPVFSKYESVCRAVQPSWADNNGVNE